MSTFGFKTHMVTEPLMGLNANSQVLNSTNYKILDKTQTQFLDCGLALINLKEDYYSSYRNEPNSFKFKGKNIGFAFVNKSKSIFEKSLSNEMIAEVEKLCFKHNVKLTRWVQDYFGTYVEDENGTPIVIEGCMFMKPSVGIKLVWEEFKVFLMDYHKRQEYILEDSLEKLEEETQLKTKEDAQFDSLLTMLSQ